MTGRITLEDVVERMKGEILEDIRNHNVPIDVSSFAELHDYVDANVYGGFCEDETSDTLHAQFGGTEGGDMPEALMDFFNEAQTAIDTWIKNDLQDHMCTEWSYALTEECELVATYIRRVKELQRVGERLLGHLRGYMPMRLPTPAYLTEAAEVLRPGGGL